MSEPDVETTREIIPSKTIIDFSVLDESLSSEDKFRSRVKKITREDKLPVFFPGLPDFFKAKKQGLTTNQEYIDSQLSLPRVLYDSDTYIENLELRGPIEEIIIRYEKERKRWGLKTNRTTGAGWSKRFQRLMKKIPTSHMSISEKYLDPGPGMEPPENPKGRKIA